MNLGEAVKTARTSAGLSLVDAHQALASMGEDVSLSQLKRMEDGQRPGDPRIWGALWQLFRLPLYDLYKGLGIPRPPGMEPSLANEIASAVATMPEPAQRLVLGFTRHAPALVTYANAESQRSLSSTNKSADAPPGDEGVDGEAEEEPDARRRKPPWKGAAKKRTGRKAAR